MKENTKRVFFSDKITVYQYESEGISSDLFSDRQRNEPDIIDRHKYKSKVIEIFNEVMKKEILIVLGNLGRHPYLLEYYLDVYTDPRKTIRIHSYWWNYLTIDPSYKDDGTSCDLLIILEPLCNETISRPIYAKSLLVLTSFKHHCSIYTHRHLYLGNCWKILNTLKQFHHLKQPNAYKFKPQIFCNDRVPYFPESNVTLTLSKWQSKEEIFLCILNMIDFISHLKIKSWAVEIK